MVTKQKFITRQDIRDNPDKIYLFGDNLHGVGFGGQARQMRGEPNAIGIPTKKNANMYDRDFFTDEEYEQNIKAIDKAFNRIPKGADIVISEAGLGTGLAQLDTRAPKTFAYLMDRLTKLEED